MTLEEAITNYYKIVKEVQVDARIEELKNDFEDTDKYGMEVGCEINDRVFDKLIPQINTYELSELDYYWKQMGECCQELPQYKNRFSTEEWYVLYYLLSTKRVLENYK